VAKITLGPVDCGANGTAYDFRAIKFDNKEEQERVMMEFRKICDKLGITLTEEG